MCEHGYYFKKNCPVCNEARIKELEESLELARNYKGIEARPCPLCEYKNGKFIKSCSMHSRIKELEEEQSERAADHMNLVEENHQLREQLARAEERLKRVQYKSHKNAYKVHGHFCQAVIDNKAIHDSVEQYFKDKGE